MSPRKRALLAFLTLLLPLAASPEDGLPPLDTQRLPEAARPALESAYATFQTIAERQDQRQDQTARTELADAAGRVGEHYHAHHLYRDALDSYEFALSLAPERARWQHLAGIASLELGRHHDAAAYFQAALEADPELSVARIRAARALADAGDLAAAEHLFQAAIDERRAEGRESARGLAAAEAGLGRIAYMQARFGDAVTHLERALASAPGARGLHHTLGLAYRHLGDVERARAHLEQAGQGLPPLDDPILAEVLSLNRGVQYQIERAQRLLDQGRPGAAVAAYLRATEFAPEDATVWVGLGAARMAAGELEAARRALEQALALDPGQAAAHFERAELATLEGDPGAAEQAYRQTLQAQPEFPSARFRLAVLLLAQERTEEAIPEFRELVRRHPDNLYARGLWLASLLHAGRCGELAPALREAREQAPRRGELIHLEVRRAAVCPEVGAESREQALSLARQLVEARGSLVHLEALAMIQAATGRSESAVAIQDRILATLPPDADPRWRERLAADRTAYMEGRGPSRAFSPGHPSLIPEGVPGIAATSEETGDGSG